MRIYECLVALFCDSNTHDKEAVNNTEEQIDTCLK